MIPPATLRCGILESLFRLDGTLTRDPEAKSSQKTTGGGAEGRGRGLDAWTRPSDLLTSGWSPDLDPGALA